MSRAFFEAYYQTYNSEDPEALRVFYDPEVELHSAQGVIRGVDAVLDVYRGIIAEFKDQMTPLDICERSDHIHVRILDEFTAKVAVEDFMGSAFAAGEQFSLNLLAEYRLRDGRIVRADIAAL